MNRKFRIKLTRPPAAANHVAYFSENERPEKVKVSGDEAAFTRKDGEPVSFTDVHMDKLMQCVKERAEECDADYSIEELTGKREFQIKLESNGFKADFHVTYSEGNPVPLVTSSLHDPLMPLPDGTPIPFEKLNPLDLQSFIASMAKSNGLNFEFVDLDD